MMCGGVDERGDERRGGGEPLKPLPLFKPFGSHVSQNEGGCM